MNQNVVAAIMTVLQLAECVFYAVDGNIKYTIYWFACALITVDMTWIK